MAIETLKLNPMQIEAAKAKDKEYNLSDGAGLFLRVKPNATKLWIFNFSQPITKKRQSISYGVYPEVTLADARKKAEIDRKLLKQNKDPKQERDKAKANELHSKLTTFKLVADKWLELQKHKIAPTTYKKTKRYFEKDIIPTIGHIAIKEITAQHGINVIEKVSGRGSQEIARKTARTLNQVMTFAVNTGLAPYNPLAGIKEVIPKTKVTHRPTLQVNEISELMNALRYSSAKVTTRCLIEWQLHTMTRPRETAEAKWSEIDFKNKLWIIPAERMKMNREHRVPLTIQTLNILETMKSFSGNRDFIFASHNKPNCPVNAQTANKALRDMGFTGRLVAHGLRALASTTLNENGFDDDVIETALAHGDENKIRKAYNRAQYIEKRRVMMQWWSDWVEKAKSEAPNINKYNIVNLR
ncbi:tyrosine-type recombinase/integrase [Glaciecola sp. 1036]|uniref:tyrosine-type recombinase/integrase n=1 Tax=Alteromonadaceae TaxID=72275 RepID=UPI003D067195